VRRLATAAADDADSNKLMSTVTIDVSPSPTPSSHTSTDADAATEQLLAETRASASKSPHLAQPYAVLGASLLNAARAEHRPAPMARKTGNGELSRSSFLPVPPRTNLARRRDVYELAESPEKSVFKLPQKVNQAPLKVLKKKRVPEKDPSEELGMVPELPESDRSEINVAREASEQALSGHEEGLIEGNKRIQSSEEPHLPSSPPNITLGSEDAEPATPREPTCKEEQRSSISRSDRTSSLPVTQGDVVIATYLPNGKPRCPEVCYKEKKPLGPRYEQCQSAGSNTTGQDLRCHTHMQKPASVQCEHVSGQGVQCQRVGRNGRRRCLGHAANKEPAKSALPEKLDVEREATEPDQDKSTTQSRTKRKLDDAPETTQGQQNPTKKRRTDATSREDTEGVTSPAPEARSRTKSTKAHPEVVIPVRKPKTRQPVEESRDDEEEHVANAVDVGESVEQSRDAREDHVAGTIEVAVPTPLAASTPRTRSTQLPVHSSKSAATKAKQITTRSNRDVPKSSKRARSTASDDDNVSDLEDIQQSEGKDAAVGRGASVHENAPSDDQEEADAKVVRPSTHQPGTIDLVFDFLDINERDGKCQTELGTSIKRICDKSTMLCHEEDLTIEDIVENVDDVRAVLKQAAGVEEDDRRAFKTDAYAYVFRSLTLFLQSLHNWFAKKPGEVAWSLEGLRVLSPLIKDILAFKDTISGRKVSVRQRYQGDQIIMDVDSHLITPLREVFKTYSGRLGKLEAREQSRLQFEQLQLETQEAEAEAQRRQEAKAARQKRWTHWQNLHIKRQQCEPDFFRRKKLYITKLEELEDTDANGDQFDRVDVFRHPRTLPPPRRSVVEKEWTTAQENALIEGLMRFAGTLIHWHYP
jgi:hypothetical protein